MMMGKFLVLLLFFSTATAMTADDILPPNLDPSLDCDIEETERHQLRLFYQYRGLYDFRRHFHPDHIADFTERSGSVIFLIYQNEVLQLDCPCTSEDNKVDKWISYGEGKESIAFNNAWASGKKKVSSLLSVKAPRGAFYYRTYGCFAGDKYHYFNVFTRPGPITKFPVSILENTVRDSGNEDTLSWFCYTTHPRVHGRDCGQEPLKTGWVFPNTQINHHEGIPLLRDSSLNDTELSVSDSGFDEIAKQSPKVKELKDVGMGILSGSMVRIQKKAENAKHAGHYECVITDRNGLSSSFRYDNLDEDSDRPENQVRMNKIEGALKYEGDVEVHIREFFWIYVPVALIIVIMVITAVVATRFPDNLEEYEIQALEQEQAQRRLEMDHSNDKDESVVVPVAVTPPDGISQRVLPKDDAPSPPHSPSIIAQV